MNERILTTYYPKLKRSVVEQKINSTSKLNLTEKIKILNLDYVDVLSQIKSRKNNIENSTLYQNLTNNIQNQNCFKYKLLNKNIKKHSALITEPHHDKRKLKNYKNLSNNFTYSNSYSNNRLMLGKNFSTPKKLINKIIKFDEEKKVVKNIKLVKKRIPIETTNSYRDFIKKMNEFNFIKYTNSHTDFAHKVRSSFFLDKVNESKKKEIIKNKIYLQKEKEKIEDEKELRDKVFYPSLDLQRISKQIKLILRNENRFNQFAKIHEKFFDNFSNRINFLYDNFKPPNIKNNLTRITFEDMKNEKKLGLINRVGNEVINYLSYAKIKLQRQKDERIRFLIEKNKIKRKYSYYKKLSINNIYNSKEEIEKIIYKNYYIKDEDEFLPDKDSISFSYEEILEKKNYFENKIEKFNNVYISESRARRFVFDNLNNNFDLKKNKNKDYLEIY